MGACQSVCCPDKGNMDLDSPATEPNNSKGASNGVKKSGIPVIYSESSNEIPIQSMGISAQKTGSYEWSVL